MKIYHFVNARYGIKDLKERRLKIARIMELNDPFEFLGADLSVRNFRKAIKATKRSLNKTEGILCFSKNWSNPVLWSHYADKHKGLCLGFEIPRHLLVKIAYVENRILHNGEIDRALMRKFLTTKYTHWSYEEEYRVFLSLEEEIDGLFYADFSDAIKLEQVILGAHSRVTRAQVNEALGDLADGIEVFKARAAFRSFDVVRNKNEELA